MKVLLCNPNTNLTVSNQAGSLSNTVAICAPLGIGYLAGMLRERGHDAAICDFFDSSEEQIAATLKDHAPDVVGISCFTEHRGAALKLARLAKVKSVFPCKMRMV